jgi:hypothetical protein
VRLRETSTCPSPDEATIFPDAQLMVAWEAKTASGCQIKSPIQLPLLSREELLEHRWRQIGAKESLYFQ